jgi:hypothetical protein
VIAQLQTPFDLTQPAGQVLAIVFFLIPGLNCTWIVERLAGRSLLSGPERLFRAIAWSLFLYVAASPWLLWLAHRVTGRRKVWPWEPIFGFACLEFLVPVMLALTVVWIRRSDWFRRWLKLLTRIDSRWSSWDVAFASLGPFFVRAKLKTGERVGGVFGERSFASAYPESQDVFVEEAWSLDEDGAPEEPLPGSRGLFFRQEDVEVLEFLEMEGGDGEATDR